MRGGGISACRRGRGGRDGRRRCCGLSYGAEEEGRGQSRSTWAAPRGQLQAAAEDDGGTYDSELLAPGGEGRGEGPLGDGDGKGRGATGAGDLGDLPEESVDGCSLHGEEAGDGREGWMGNQKGARELVSPILRPR